MGGGIRLDEKTVGGDSQFTQEPKREYDDVQLCFGLVIDVLTVERLSIRARVGHVLTGRG